jgi:peptide/nickel transport system permease protein
MIRPLLVRLVHSLAVLAAMSLVVYGLIGLMPGDPIALMLSADPKLTAEDAARLKALYGLDRPLLERYGTWLAAAIEGDFGYSRLYSRPVFEILVPALGHTLILMLSALALSVAIALPLGILAAAKAHSPLDYAINLVAFAGLSVPPFWLALLLIIAFAVKLPWLPAASALSFSEQSLGQGLVSLILPVATLTLAQLGGHLRYVRTAVRDSLSHDFIRTARAKGLSERRIVIGHALRQAMIPIATILALDFGALFSGALITETIFAYPGMGKLIYDAVLGNDYNLALVALLLATAVTLAANWFADLAYVALDPRVSLDGGAR